MRIAEYHSIWLMRATGIVALAFGAATIRAGGSVLFGTGAQAAGNFVGFVLWFNFLAGFAYVLAGAGLWLRRAWSAWLALALAATTILVFAAFGIHVPAGGAFEARTAWAMLLRSVVWLLIAALAFGGIRRAGAKAAGGRIGIASVAE